MIESVSCNYNKNPISISNLSKNKVAIAGATVIAGAFGKYVLDGPKFSENVNMNGKVVAITGGNTGLGKETAVKLASLGAEVVILCKSIERAEEAVKEINERSGNNKCSAIQLNLSNMKSIEKCANNFKTSFSKIDVLINNAGIMALPTRQETDDGFEAHLGVNHLGHFVLTYHLLDLLKKSPNARYLTYIHGFNIIIIYFKFIIS